MTLPAMPERRALPVIGSGIANHALGYTADQMREYAISARAGALEEAAKACELLRDKWVDGSDQWGRPCPARVRVTTSDCAAAIRALAQPPGEKK